MTTPLTWHDVLAEEKQQPYFINTLSTVATERQSGQTIYPPQKDVFNAFRYTELSDVKVVILGQDPYHGSGEAHGLAFSVLPGVKTPPSLRNIFQELHSDLGVPLPAHGTLSHWAQQGVLLLNTVLTVRANQANSHKEQGWEKFTDKIIMLLNARTKPLVFILWGKPAQQKKTLITNQSHLVLSAPHPSPLSAFRGFFGSKPFSKTNNFLMSQGLKCINWQIPDNKK